MEGVSVTYRTPYERKPTLRGTVVRLGRRQRLVREIQAVRDVSLEVPHGSVLGVVGANGAGKSTLMRTIAGILPPSAGRLEVRGRVSTLLALGVGFNRDLTGRDNVMLGGLAAGLTRRELEQRYDDIVSWAELEEFIDLPMRTYSAGMFGRLAFSVSLHMNPDVLLIDEALATGDSHFKRKTLDKIRELCGEARTIVIVSHALQNIRELCDHAIWMHKGELRLRDEPDAVIDAYTGFLGVTESAIDREDI